MVRLPLNTRKEPVDTDDAGHDTYRHECLLQHRALLDMQLDVAVQPVWPARACQRGRPAPDAAIASARLRPSGPDNAR